jgi:hypothetical protein
MQVDETFCRCMPSGFVISEEVNTSLVKDI